MYSNTIFKSLEDLGCNELECQLYYDLLATPQLTITQLAGTYGVHREKIYIASQKLVDLGLANYPTSGKKIIVASPSVILNLLRQKKVQFSRSEKDFGDVLPDLLPIFQSENQQPVVKLYEGIDQFFGIFDQFIDEAKDEILCFVNPKHFHDVIGIDYLELWIKRRKAKGLNIRIISTAENAQQYLLTTDNPKEDLRDVRFLVRGDNDFKATFYLSGSRASIWNPLISKAISIQDKVIVDTFKFVFNKIWDGLRPQ